MAKKIVSFDMSDKVKNLLVIFKHKNLQTWSDPSGEVRRGGVSGTLIKPGTEWQSCLSTQ